MRKKQHLISWFKETARQADFFLCTNIIDCSIKRMHSSRMCTARSSGCLEGVSTRHPPGADPLGADPRSRPPLQADPPPRRPPWEQAPLPPAARYAGIAPPAARHAGIAHTPAAARHAGIPPVMHAGIPPPRGQNHRRLWNYNLAPTSLRAVKTFYSL